MSITSDLRKYASTSANAKIELTLTVVLADFPAGMDANYLTVVKPSAMITYRQSVAGTVR